LGQFAVVVGKDVLEPEPVLGRIPAEVA
jgi:hypothetical protein